MNGLKLLFKDKLTILIAALLAVTLLACIPFVPSSAKYTTTSETETFNLKLASSKPILRLGATDYNSSKRLSFRRALGELIYEKYPDIYADGVAALADVKHIDFVYAQDVDPDDVLIATGSDTVAESGVVTVHWDPTDKRITISSEATIYSSYNCQDLFAGSAATTKEDYVLCNLESVNLQNLDTSQASTISNMFIGTKIKTFDFKAIDTSNVEHMSGVFNDCDEITSVGGADCNIVISDLKTGDVDTFANIFANCDNLESVDLSVLTENTVKLLNVENMFYNSTKLKTIEFGNNFSTSIVTNFKLMFKRCSSLEKLDLSMFDTSAGVHMNEMFYECTALKEINFGDKFTASAAPNVPSMFRKCTSLSTLDLSKFNFSNVTTNFGDMFAGYSTTTPLVVIKPKAEGAWPKRADGNYLLEYTTATGNTKWTGVTFE